MHAFSPLPSLKQSNYKISDDGWDAYSNCYYSRGKPHVGIREEQEVCYNNCGSYLGYIFASDEVETKQINESTAYVSARSRRDMHHFQRALQRRISWATSTSY